MTSPPAGRLYGSVNYGSMDALIAKVITAELSIRLDPVGPGNGQTLAGFPRQTVTEIGDCKVRCMTRSSTD